MLVPLTSIDNLLRSPGHPNKTLSMEWEGGRLKRASSGQEDFPIVAGQPVLIDFARSLCRKEWFATARQNVSVIGERPNLARTIKGVLTGSRATSKRNIAQFKQLLPPSPVLLMVGAGALGVGCEVLYEDEEIRQIAFDIYPSNLTQFVADAHQIPLEDASVDGVVVQAVLEHVLDPSAVVKEVFRVLKPGGLVYAETPFMQQVHEGAYDFTRFTELGHRWLFRHFEEIQRSVIGGPGLSLYWSVRYFWRALLRHRRLADIVSLPFLFFPLIDHFLPLRHKIESANGVSFLGRKSELTLSPADLVSYYRGPDI